jgi:hypothetical protein
MVRERRIPEEEIGVENLLVGGLRHEKTLKAIRVFIFSNQD